MKLSEAREIGLCHSRVCTENKTEIPLFSESSGPWERTRLHPSSGAKTITDSINGKERGCVPPTRGDLERFVISTSAAKDLLVVRNFRKPVFASP